MSTKNKESKIYLLDTMVLINFTERCVSHDIFGYFEKLGIHFQIVEEVKKEFFKKVKPLGEARFKAYTRNNILQIISNDDIEIDIETMKDFVNKGFGKGELFQRFITSVSQTWNWYQMKDLFIRSLKKNSMKR